MKFAEFRTSETARFGQLDRFQPEFCITLRLLYMHVARLAAFATEKKEAKAADPKNLWHVGGARKSRTLRQRRCLLHVVIHRELVRMRTEAESVVFFLFHLDPVRDEVFVEDVAFEEEAVVVA